MLSPESCLLIRIELEPGKVWAMSLWSIVGRGMRDTIINKEVVVDICGVTIETKESRRRRGFVILVVKYKCTFSVSHFSGHVLLLFLVVVYNRYRTNDHEYQCKSTDNAALDRTAKVCQWESSSSS